MMHDILGVRVDDLSDQDLQQWFERCLQGDRACLVVTPNPEMVLLSRQDPSFRDVLNRADLRLPDGVGLKWASPQLKHRHTGVDALALIAKLCEVHGKRLLLLGGEAGEGVLAARRLRSLHPMLQVSDLDPGTVNVDGSLGQEVMHTIEQARPDVIAVALGQKKQELCMSRIAPSIPSVRLLIGVGGAFNMISGRLRRAPIWMRQLGLEWLWRVAIEPSRLPRTFRATVVFPLTVIWSKIMGR